MLAPSLPLLNRHPEEAAEIVDGNHIQWIEGAIDQDTGIVEGDEETYHSAREDCYGRHFATTEKSRLCWVPPFAEISDLVHVPFGDHIPFLVRARDYPINEHVFKLVEKAYAQGVMWGELLEGEDQNLIITIVCEL